MSRYVQRLGRLFEALQILDLYPMGISLDDLAGVIGCTTDEIRADLSALNSGSDLGPDTRSGFVLFLSKVPDVDVDHIDADDEDDDDLYVEADAAVAVRLHGDSFHHGAGGLTVADLGAVLQQAQDLLQLDPGDESMARVVAEIRSRWLPGVTEVWRPGFSGQYENLLADAVKSHKHVWIRYERVWRPGIIERVIWPYRLVRTHRGFEVDAATEDDPQRIKTYLVDQIRQAELRAETFEPPGDVVALCDSHRRTTDVVIVVPKDREWTVEYLSEEARVEARDEETQLRLALLEPVDERVGLLIIQAGEDAFVASPAQLVDAPAKVADTLWEHHEL